MDARKKASGVVIHTPKLSDDADARFYRNPEGNALFAARFVTALAGMSNYLAQTEPRGGNKNRYRTMYKMYVHTAS